MKIVSKNEVVLNAIPELKKLKSDKVENVTYQNFEKRMRRLESQNLDTYGIGLSFSALQGYFNLAVVEIQKDSQLLVINKRAYRLIRDFLTSEEFAVGLKN